MKANAKQKIFNNFKINKSIASLKGKSTKENIKNILKDTTILWTEFSQGRR
jgi:hypothetical protein